MDIIIDCFVCPFIADHPVGSIRKKEFGSGTAHLCVPHPPVSSAAVLGKTGQPLTIESVRIHDLETARPRRGCNRPGKRGIRTNQSARPVVADLRSQFCIRAELVNPPEFRQISHGIDTGAPSVIIVLIENGELSEGVQNIHTGDRARLLSCGIQSRQKDRGKNGDDRNRDKDNLSNILICSILAMTRKKAEGELSNESVDLCTAEQREG